MLAELGAAGWELALPLRSGGRLVGLYLLGPRRNGDLYTRQEVETLRVLGRQVAASLENARLYAQVERYTQDLEEVISERTGQLAVANQELSSERDRLNVILQNMADGLLVTDSTGEIALVNPSLVAIMHRPPSQLLGQPASTALPFLTVLLTQAMERLGEVLAADLEIEAKILYASSSALRDCSAVITVLRDVTREKEVDRMKTEFVSTVSHELRTPLTSVLGFAKLVSKTVEKEVLPWVPADNPRGQRAMQRIRQNLDIIIGEGQRLTRLINDVLDIAKMEAGRVEWRDRKLDLAAVIRQAVENVFGLAAAKALPVRLQLAEGLPPLLADPDRILQVMTNLLSNAIKFTDQGEVAVTARALGPGEEGPGHPVSVGNPGAVLVTVRDTGVGIPAEAMPRLFQRFQQVGDTLRDKPKGTGLGLAICREIVTHYKGAIWAESEPGMGSTFCFTLPLVPVVEKVSPRLEPVEMPAASVPTEARSRTVLVVDDEPPIRQLLRQTLTEAGYVVIEASDGAAAIALSRQHQPDLLILDVKMPGLLGTDVAQLLQGDPTTAHIPIVILSVEDRPPSLDLAVAAYLTKPVQIEVLLSTVAEVVARGRRARRMR